MLSGLFSGKIPMLLPFLSYVFLNLLLLLPSWFVWYMHLHSENFQTNWSIFSAFWISIDLLLLLYLLYGTQSIRLNNLMLSSCIVLYAILWIYEIYSKLIVVLASRKPLLYNDLFLINDGIYLFFDLFKAHWHLLLLIVGLFLFTLIGVIPGVWRLLAHGLQHSPFYLSPFLLGFLLLAGTVGMHQIQHTRLEDAPAQLISGRIRHNIQNSIALYRETHNPEFKEKLQVQLQRKFAPLTLRPDIYIFVIESYGKILAERRLLREEYIPMLSDIESTLTDSGWHAVTNYSAAPVSGSGSWLSTASLLSGLHIDNQVVYDYLTSSHTPTYLRFFRENNYHTLILEPPSRTRPGLPLSNQYRFDTVITYHDLAYQGFPQFGWGLIPDQYSLYMTDKAWLNDFAEPVFFYFPMVTSHAPWTAAALPPYLNHAQSRMDFYSAYQQAAEHPHQATQTTNAQNISLLRGYADAIHYAFKVIRDFLLENVSNQSIVIILGDHQPPLLVNKNDSYQTPVHVLSRNPRFLRQFRTTGFVQGLYKKHDLRDTVRHDSLMAIFTRALFTPEEQNRSLSSARDP